MTKLIIRILTNALAIFLAVKLVDGITLTDENNLTVLLFAGLILGLINFFVKPILKLISAPLILFTLGLFTIIINIVSLFLLDYLVDELSVSGWIAAFWGVIVISAVNIFINSFSNRQGWVLNPSLRRDKMILIDKIIYVFQGRV